MTIRPIRPFSRLQIDTGDQDYDLQFCTLENGLIGQNISSVKNTRLPSVEPPSDTILSVDSSENLKKIPRS